MSLTKRHIDKIEINRPTWNYLYEENKRLKKEIERLTEKRGK